ncbi:MAG: TraB/GumN family protein [Verrucomicrobia bacterium]|nr:MAG: TraB/GumN family protein [Verrucomicrobiota bacterium]
MHDFPRPCWLLPVALIFIIFAAISAKAEPAMWVIKDADSTIYLIGTLHLLKHDTEWNAEKVKKTVHDATELWLEVADFDNEAALAPLMAKFGIDPQHPLSSRLNGEQRQKLEKIAATYAIPVASLEPMRPWLAALVLAVGPIMKAGYDPKAGVERVLNAQALAEGDKIRGFETAEEQIQILAGLSDEEQIAFLNSILDDLEKGLDLLDKLAKAWIDGDTDTIKRLSVDDMKKEAPTVYQKLIVQRNIAWSEKIAAMLKGSGVQQIAVGAAHLVGPDSVQAQLAKRGIKVEKY